MHRTVTKCDTIWKKSQKCEKPSKNANDGIPNHQGAGEIGAVVFIDFCIFLVLDSALKRWRGTAT